MNGVIEGKVTVARASGLMGVSERHAWRLLAAYRGEGPAAVAHGNRGRKPATTTCPQTREKVRELAEGPYAGFNHTHLTEMLAEREDIHLSRSTVRRVLLAGGLPSPRRRKAPRRYSRRERYPQEGMLLQIDGSRHDWLEGRGPYLTLVGAVEDATGTVPFALFRQQEDAHGYMLLLKDIIERHGVPLALYSDRHGIFQRSPKEPESSSPATAITASSPTGTGKPWSWRPTIAATPRSRMPSETSSTASPSTISPRAASPPTAPGWPSR